MKKVKNNTKKSNKIVSKIILLFVVGYVTYIFINQQININKYAVEEKYYENLIQEENLKNSELTTEKENINSDEYIEKVAREKLGYVMPNETIYIDANRY